MDSKLWFNKQRTKNKQKKNINNNSQVKNIKNKTKEESNKMMLKEENKKVLEVSVDAGKGYAKWFYEIDGREETGIKRSTVRVGAESSMGRTVYLGDKPYDFNGVTKVVEVSNVSKNNEEHRAIMQNILFDIAIKEGITDFDVIMCTSLDQYKVIENVEAMKSYMLEAGTFNAKKIVKDEEVEKEITIHNVVIEPETLVAARYAKTKLKQCYYSVMVDIGTLNVGIVPLVEGNLDMDAVIAPRHGYQHMLEMFKTYADSNSQQEYSIRALEGYIENHFEKQTKKYDELNKMFANFFATEYAPLLKKEIAKAGFGEMATLIFLGGTSIRLKKLIEKNFKEYEAVEVIEDIHATVKGAYKKGIRDLAKEKAKIKA